MIIEAAIMKRLLSSTDLTNLVSNRVFYIERPEKSRLPAITFRKYAGSRESTMGDDPGIVEGMFQFDTWSTISAENAKSIAKQIQISLQNFRGIMGGDGGVQVDAVEYTNEIDNYEEPVKVYHIIQEFTIWYHE